jgi:glycine cleavage system H protein
LLILDELLYSEEHVWVRRDGDYTFTIGITDYAQAELGDLNYIELPNEGDEIALSEPFGSVECESLVADLYAPLCGYVLQVNGDVLDDPALINESPYTDGWILRVKCSNPDELDTLMSADDYEEYVLTAVL